MSLLESAPSRAVTHNVAASLVSFILLLCFPYSLYTSLVIQSHLYRQSEDFASGVSSLAGPITSLAILGNRC